MGTLPTFKRLIARFRNHTALIRPTQSEWLSVLRDMTPAAPNPYEKRRLQLADNTTKRTFGDV